MGRAATWWPVARWLADHGRVVGLDARGHGRSQARGPWTTQRLAADVVELLAEIGPAVVVGHSMGGLHGLVAAAARPDLVRALVVEDMGVDFVGAPDTRAWFAAMPTRWPALAAVREAFGAYGDYMIECVEERDDGWALLAAVEHTTAIAAEWARAELVGRAAGGARARRCSSRRRRASCRRGRWRRWRVGSRTPGTWCCPAGHLVHRDAPDAYRAALTEWLPR